MLTNSLQQATIEKQNFMKKLAKAQNKQMRALRRMKNEAIDLTDIPQLRGWDKAIIGKFYRPIRNL